MNKRLEKEFADIKKGISDGTIQGLAFLDRSERTWLLDVRGARVRLEFTPSYPFEPFTISAQPNQDLTYVKLSSVLGFSNDELQILKWKPTTTVLSLLERPPPSAGSSALWVDRLVVIDKNSSILNGLGFAMPVSISSGGKAPSSHRIHGIYDHQCDESNMPLCIDGILNAEEASQYIKCAEALRFDNSRHPEYQNESIDESELSYRINDRCVYRANDEEIVS